MAQDPGLGYLVIATVLEMEGECSAGHQVGDSFEISCHNPAGLCGYFYHDLFPSLMTFQFGGSLPWWSGDTITLRCSDPNVNLRLQLQRFKRD